MSARSSSKSSGFTLVELAMSILLIGIFLTLVVKGTELIQNTRFKKTIATVNDITSAVMGFHQKYDAWPGDMPSAGTRLPYCDASCNGGNGDGSIGRRAAGPVIDQTGSVYPEAETSLFWKHLAKADFLNNVNSDANFSVPEMGETHPRSPMGGVFSIYNRGANSHGLSVKFTPNGDPGFLTPQKAQQLDGMVDGEPNPSMGKMLSNGGPGCLITDSHFSPDDMFNYCYVMFNLDF